MNRELERYAKYLTQKHRPRITVDNYMAQIRSFRDFVCRGTSGCRSWREVTEEDAHGYCNQLFLAGRKEATINKAITSLRLFYDYLVIRDEAQENPFREVDFHKIKREAPIVLDGRQSARLVGAPMREYQVLIETLDEPRAMRHGKFIYLRDQLILELLYYSGMKVSELLSLCDRDIDREEMTVAISGKAGCDKGRTLSLPECVIATFKDYVRNRNERWPDILFQANPILLRNRLGSPIGRRSVSRKIAHYAQKSGLHPGISAETLRATFTLRALRSGAEAATIQFLLGFEDMSSAEFYASRFKSLIRRTR